MRADAARRRSIDASRRAKIPVEAAKVSVAVLTILVPFFGGSEALRAKLGLS